jgi:hypothetical protein
MPSSDGDWYWDVIRDVHNVVARGVADPAPAACQQAADSARNARLLR